MRLLETFVSAPLAGAIGWTLLHSLWEGAAVAAVLAASLFALRTARARYAAACMALLAVLGAFGVTFAVMIPEAGAGLGAVQPPLFAARNLEPGAGSPGLVNPELAAVAPWLAAFWIAGVWIFFLQHTVGWMSVCRMRRRGVCCAPERWQNELARLGARLRVTRPVLLLESCLAEAPVVLGHFRPVILMPVGLLAGLPADQVEAILLHELAHIRRWDYLANVFQRFVEGLLFYHPAVWWISRVIRAERENCCDDAAVAVSGDARGYATALAALEESRWPGREPALAATGGSLVKRIRRLLYPKAPTGAWTPLFAAAILIATAALAFAAWHSQEGAAAQTPYEKWVNEDVVYIISPEERAAFLKLATDEEREKFVEQFWLRRDPTPGTPVNEFKQEHYRRIAYANQRFSTATTPGWKTGRGRAYIMYGPADEIESHPPQRSEVWRYRHLDRYGDNVFFHFKDREGTGDYKLVEIGSGR